MQVHKNMSENATFIQRSLVSSTAHLSRAAYVTDASPVVASPAKARMSDTQLAVASFSIVFGGIIVSGLYWFL